MYCALRALVPDALPGVVPHVPRALRALDLHMPCAIVPNSLLCVLRVFVTHAPRALRTLVPHVLSRLQSLVPCAHCALVLRCLSKWNICVAEKPLIFDNCYS